MTSRGIPQHTAALRHVTELHTAYATRDYARFRYLLATIPDGAAPAIISLLISLAPMDVLEQAHQQRMEQLDEVEQAHQQYVQQLGDEQ